VANLFGRVASAVQGGITGMQQGWNGSANPLDAFNPQTYDSFAARSARYGLNWSYYDNSVYGVLLGQVVAAKGVAGLYKFIRMIYNPVPRLVNLRVAKIYGSTLDLETGTEGGIPLATVDDKLAQAIIQLWKMSNWNLNKNLFVRHGSIYGDNFIKCVNDERRQRVYMELLHPGKVSEFKRNYVGEIEYAKIEYVVDKSATNPERFEYMEIITPDSFEYFKDGKSYDYETGLFGNGKKPNDYGFVPISQVQDSAIGFQSGASCFQDGRTTIDELNDAASVLADAIRNAVDGVYVATGVNTSTDAIDMTRTTRDKVRVIKLSNKDADFKSVVSPIDIAGAIENIQSIQTEIEAKYPELSLHRMREGQTPSGVAVHMLWGDAGDRLEEASGNYDDATCRAQAMGVAMMAYHGYKGGKGFAVTDYGNGNLTHTIKNRSMFDESLDKQSRLNVYAMSASQPTEIQRLMLQEAEVDEATIEKIVSQTEEQEEKDMEMAARGLASGLRGNAEDEESDKKPTREEQAKKQADKIAKANQAALNS
jgi:hypothetical protein